MIDRFGEKFGYSFGDNLVAVVQHHYETLAEKKTCVYFQRLDIKSFCEVLDMYRISLGNASHG